MATIMKTSKTIKQFEKWATERGMNIEKVTFRSGSSILVSYKDHGTGMACEGWLAREDLYNDRTGLTIGKLYRKPKPTKLIPEE